MRLLFPVRTYGPSLFLTISVSIFLFTCCPPVQAAETKSAIGVITAKIVKPTSVYRQYPAGKRDGLQLPNEIPIADSVVFEIKVEGLSGRVRYSLNSVAAKKYDIGQRVQIDYVKRAILPFRTRIYVREMRIAK